MHLLAVHLHPQGKPNNCLDHDRDGIKCQFFFLFCNFGIIQIPKFVLRPLDMPGWTCHVSEIHFWVVVPHLCLVTSLHQQMQQAVNVCGFLLTNATERTSATIFATPFLNTCIVSVAACAMDSMPWTWLAKRRPNNALLSITHVKNDASSFLASSVSCSPQPGRPSASFMNGSVSCCVGHTHSSHGRRCVLAAGELQDHTGQSTLSGSQNW